MILVLGDDRVLTVYQTVDEVVGDIEALDIEECMKSAFDDDARPYSIEWVRHNRSTPLPGFLKFIKTTEQGEYRLVPAGPPNPKALLATLERAVGVEPRSAEELVRGLRRKLQSVGA